MSEILLIVILVAVVALFTQRLKLVRNRTTAEWTRYSIMLFFLIFVGFHKMAQPSVTQLLTVIHKFIGDFKWELFLLDPMIFILWWFIAITLILWGRGVFCGWICPYGTLTEFAYRIFHKVFPDRFKFEFSYKTHSKLVYIKYLIFLFLLAISFYSMALAERYAEVEPFKTAFLVGLNREWYYVTYFFVLFIACLVSYRFFCKYICPLGAGLAIPSKFSIFGIKRRDFCSSCNICTKECGSGAIDESGVIDKQECLYCLDCEENYVDSGKCPPLIKEERNKRKSETPSP